MKKIFLFAILSTVCLNIPSVWAQKEYAKWLEELIRTAIEQEGISFDTVNSILPGIELDPSIIELDSNQPEFKKTIAQYLKYRLSPTWIKKGRNLLQKHRGLLNRISQDYPLSSSLLVSFWGNESYYGSNTGNKNIFRSLVTLSYNGRRGAFFKKQLFEALRIVDEKQVPVEKMLGSWAGAMGALQFLPSVFRKHAVDYDRDGRIDVWDNLGDLFASGAKFLNKLGLNSSAPWGYEVILPEGFDYFQSGFKVKKSIGEWKNLGVRRPAGLPLLVNSHEKEHVLYLPNGVRGPAFLLYPNFRIIMKWNYSINYALAVSLLADQIAGKPALTKYFDKNEKPLKAKLVQQMQEKLIALGYSPGTPDGIVGSNTRRAIQHYQKDRNLVADGYPTPRLIRTILRDRL